jgi:hypothetical protein
MVRATSAEAQCAWAEATARQSNPRRRLLTLSLSRIACDRVVFRQREGLIWFVFIDGYKFDFRGIFSCVISCDFLPV